MKTRPPAIIALVWACLILIVSNQIVLAGNTDTLRIMDYNILNYPGSTASFRNPYFRAVIHSAKPDVIVTLENTTQSGVTDFLNNVLNYYQAGLYSTIPFNDGPDTDPHIFYKSSKVTFLSASYFLMSDNLRNIGLFKIKDNASGDILRLYAVHLKASQGFESNRLAEATALRDTLNNLSPGTKFMVMGDFNFYTATEPAFIKLTESEADNDGRLKDPINQIGNWHDGSVFALYHTQSTRSGSLSDGGASGGLDDRFDFILTSYSSLDSNTIVSSYKAYGNDGNHLNQSINVLPNTAVLDSIANGLYYASDHLPVFCDFKFGSAVASFTQLSPVNGSTGQPVSGILRWYSSSNATSYDLYLGTTNPPTIKVSADQTDTSYLYSGLSNNSTYYWKIVGKNSNGSSDANGSPWSFTTVPLPPVAFNLLSPSNGTLNQSISGALTWQASSNATQYDVFLDVNNPPTIKVSSSQSGTSYNFDGLLYNSTYYWKVVAKNSVDSITATNSPWSFITIGPPPGAFQLISPLNGSTGQLLSGTLVWHTSLNALNYDIYLETHNPPVVKVDSNRVDTSYIYTGLLNGTMYFCKIVAKNSNGTTTSTNAPQSFTTASPPVSPSNVTSLLVTTNSLQLNWVDNATDEAGYRVYRSLISDGPFIQVDGDLPANTTTFSDQGLQINQRYYYRIVPFNVVGEGNYASINLVTFAVNPDAPLVANVHSQSLTLTVIPNTNPPVTQFAVVAIEDTNTKFIQLDGTLGSGVIWRTYAEWGGSNGINITGLVGCKSYSFSVKARNLDNVETIFSSAISQQLSCNIVTLSISSGWNLISIPVIAANHQKTSLFPTSSSDAFSYNGSYIKQDTLNIGIGYWLKFDNNNAINIIGDSIYTDTLTLVTGWNLIGSITKPVAITNITTEPSGIIASDYFSYNGIYVRTDTLYPGNGYWVKSNIDGKLILGLLLRK